MDEAMIHQSHTSITSGGFSMKINLNFHSKNKKNPHFHQLFLLQVTDKNSSHANPELATLLRAADD